LFARFTDKSTPDSSRIHVGFDSLNVPEAVVAVTVSDDVSAPTS
jgi:hypothetical protein